MARQEADREDLMREATALTQRIEFTITGQTEKIVAGYRTSGALSIYFGAEPVYHFDAQHRLRRAYVDGLLYRTQGSTLAQLERKRSESETVLHRYDLSELELSAFITTVAKNLSMLHKAMTASALKVHQQLPDNADILGTLADGLNKILQQNIQLAPAIAGKK